MRTKTIIAGSLALAFALSGCDDEDGSQQALLGGGSGSAPTPSADVQANAAGPCSPVGGAAALGTASYSSDSTAKIDMDGDASAQGHDADWQPQTTGGVNAGTYSFVVMSKQQMRDDGVSIGDWALITNDQTGQQTWAKVEDVGPGGGSGEISEAAATAVGIQYQANSFTVGNPSVSVNVYGGTADVSSDCSSSLASSNQ